MKKTLLFLVALVVTTMLSAQFTDGDLSYTILADATTVEVAGYTGTDAILTIPATATDGTTTYNVVAIGEEAFLNNAVITTVSLPTSVVTLELSAFQNSTLTTINLENVVTIAKKALTGCPLTSVGTLSSCTYIGDYSFNLCFKTLGAIEFPVLETMGVGSIYSSANNGTSLTEINLPSTLTSAGNLFLGGHTKLTKVQVNWADPSTCTFTDDTDEATTKFFRWLTKSDIIVFVPAGTKDLYEAHAHWGMFPAENIVEGTITDLDVQKSLELSIFPNPTNGVINIKGEELNNATVSVYNVNGSLLLSKNINGVSSEINISELAAGIYMVQVKAEGSVVTKRIVKQ